jgi:hypothetical protein
MRRNAAIGLAVGCAVGLASLFARGQARAAEPPYVIALRSRGAVVTPEKTRESETGGGFIQVTQLEPNLIMALMRGTVATRAGHKEGSAAIQFELNQDFEIVPTRAGLAPPRLSLAAWVIGALDSTDYEGGTAEQAPACAAIQSGGQSLVNLCIKPHSVGTGQNLLVNDRVGPLEVTVAPGGFCLHQTFALSSTQPRSHCHPGEAAADFDPDPKLDSHWNHVLKPFRAVPHRDFGFRVLVRVIEEPRPVAADLPKPKRASQEVAAPEVEDKPANP